MRHPFCAALIGTLACAAVAAPAFAGTTTLLSEDFSGVTPGQDYSGALTGSAFHVTAANVDVLGPTLFGCADNPSGHCVDIVGDQNAGGIATNGVFNLTAGDTYKITFGANLQGYGEGAGSTSFTVGLGGFSQSETLVGGPSVQYALTYTPTASQSGVSLSFLTTVPADSVHGAVLDHIVLTETTAGVPEPASWALMILGFGGAGAVLRGQRRRQAAAACA
jgi:hypothetical protein